MDEMAAMIFDGKEPIAPVDGEVGTKDLRIMGAIYEAARTGLKVDLG
jgi:predicted dehydrogenase